MDSSFRDSPLSRQYYTNTSMKERAREIAQRIAETYNWNNRGLDILFEGTKQSFDYIKGAFDCCHRDRNSVCIMGVI